MEQLRVIGVCALIFISCMGLGAAGFWVITRTEEPVTIREVRMVVRAMSLSVVATWFLLLVAPSEMLRMAGIFFVAYAAVVVIVLWIAHYKTVRSPKEESHE